MRSRPISASSRTLILSLLGVAAGTIMTAAMVVTVRGPASIARENGERVVPAQAALHRAWSAGVDGQGAMLVLVQTQDPAARTVLLIRLQADAQDQTTAWSAYRQARVG